MERRKGGRGKGERQEIRGEEMMGELVLDHEFLPSRSITHIDKCLQTQMVPVFF